MVWLDRKLIVTRHLSPMHDISPRLILASQSPRRRELLESAGYQFDIIVPSESAECGICTQESAPEMVARLAKQKAQDVLDQVERGIVIACDTLAECKGQILGKPSNQEHAEQMLRLLRGQEHRVYSGLCLWRRPADRFEVAVVCTTLTMEPITDQQLADYLASDGWIGKAGAFGYQDRTGWLRIIDGSESNVVGLPMELFREMLPRALEQ